MSRRSEGMGIRCQVHNKPESSLSIQFLEKGSEPQCYLHTHVIGSVEAFEVLMGLQMTTQVLL